jgi:hypothetical protein
VKAIEDCSAAKYGCLGAILESLQLKDALVYQKIRRALFELAHNE